MNAMETGLGSLEIEPIMLDSGTAPPPMQGDRTVRFCMTCGTKLAYGAVFCTICGTRANAAVQAADAIPAEPVTVSAAPVPVPSAPVRPAPVTSPAPEPVRKRSGKGTLKPMRPAKDDSPVRMASAPTRLTVSRSATTETPKTAAKLRGMIGEKTEKTAGSGSVQPVCGIAPADDFEV